MALGPKSFRVRRFSARSAALAAWPLCLTLLPSCQQFARIGECKEFVALANAGLTELAELKRGTKSGPTASAYAALSARYSQLSQELNELELKDRALNKAVDDVSATFSGAARLTHQYERVLESIESKPKPPSYAERQESSLRKKMAKVATDHRANVKKINQLCQP